MPGRIRLYLLQAASNLANFAEAHFPAKLYAFFDLTSLFLVDVLRLQSGHNRAKGVKDSNRPAIPLHLYEFEGCPFCRKVRETFSLLDLDHVVFPCPRETVTQAGVCINSRFRPELIKKYNMPLEFPCIYDPNTEQAIQGSDKIINYLWSKYGNNASRPCRYTTALWQPYFFWSSAIIGLLRPRWKNGFLRIPSKVKPQQKPLEFWGYEGSCFCRRVREKLSCLELSYMYHEIPRGSDEKREAFRKEHAHQFAQKKLRDTLGLVQVPYLVDPNTNTALFESALINDYLEGEYQAGDPPQELWSEYGKNDKKAA